MKRRLLLSAALLAAPVLTLAGPAQAADAEAAAPIQGLVQAILASMRAGKATPFLQRYNALAPAVDRAFDLPAVLSASVGPRLATLPADQQAALLDVFRKFTIASYAANFDSYEGERFDVVPEQRAVGSDVVVGTRLVPTRGEAVSIDYVMRRGPQGWRAIDVLLNGSISQNAVKRSDFRSLVSTSAQPLIDSLRRKVSDLSGGALS
jgi:phospholipid transport system substrate-binding protein